MHAATRQRSHLVGIVTGANLDASATLRALASEAERRRVILPPTFDVPDLDLWRGGYAAEARRWLITVAPTLQDALEIVRPCLGPLLNGSARGTWQPADALGSGKKAGISPLAPLVKVPQRVPQDAPHEQRE